MENSKEVPFTIGFSNINYEVNVTPVTSNSCSNNSSRIQDTIETINEIADYDNEAQMRRSHEPKNYNKTLPSNNSNSSGINLTSQLHASASDSSIIAEHKNSVIRKDRSASNFDVIQDREIFELSSINLSKKKSYAELPTEGRYSKILNFKYYVKPVIKTMPI